MANYNLVIDTSNFKPFDISPAMQILHDYRDAYYKYLDKLEKIAEENGQYVLPDTEDNKPYKDIMDKYNADFLAAAEDFNKHMNLRNLAELLNLFRRQRSEIAPINKAIEAYNKDTDKITALGPNVTIANLGKRTIGLYYGGINPGIQYRDNKTIQETAAGVIAGIDNALLGGPEIAGSIADLYFALKQKGIDGQEALEQILSSNPPLANQLSALEVGKLMLALNAVYNEFAFDEGTPENAKIWENVRIGAIRGILAPKYQLLTDRSYKTAHEKNMEALTEQLAIATLENEGYYKDENNLWQYSPELHRMRTKNATRSSSSPSYSGAPAYNSDEWDYIVDFGEQKYAISYDGDPDYEDEEDIDPDDYTVMRIGSDGRLHEVKTAEKNQVLKNKNKNTEMGPYNPSQSDDAGSASTWGKQGGGSSTGSSSTLLQFKVKKSKKE